MKLLFFIASLQCGGAERVAAMLCSHWARKGWDVTLATFDDGREPPFFQPDAAVRHITLDLQTRSKSPIPALMSNLKRLRTLRAFIRAERPERIMSFIDGTNVLALLASRGTGIPAVVSERIDPSHHTIPLPWRVLRRLTYGSAHAIVVQTSGAAEYFPAAWKDRIAVIPNPVTAGLLRTPASPGRKTIIAVGRLDRQKGFDLLIDAFAAVAKERPEWDVVILGEGPERRPLEEQLRSQGLGERVRLPGREPEVAAAFARSDIFVLSSRYEGFPNALCEAMAGGLPAVAFDCPSGPRDIVRDETDGLLVPAEDVRALTEALRRLTGDEHLRARLGANAPEISRRFSVERVAALWEAVLESRA